MVMIVGLALVIAGVSALEPLVMKHIFDELGGGTMRGVAFGAAALVGLVIIRELLAAGSSWLTWQTRLRVHFDLLDATVSRLHRMPLDFTRDQGVGAVMTRLDRGIQGMVGALTELSFNVIPALAYLVLAVVFMVRLDWRMALLVLLFVPLPAIIAGRAAPVQTTREKNLLERWAKIYSRFNEVLSGLVVVRSFAMEDAEKRRFLGGVHAANGVVVAGVRYDAVVTASQNLAMAAARVAAIVLGGALVLRGEATLGTVIAFLGFLSGLFGPVQGLTGIYRTVRTASVAVDQVFSILDSQDHIGDAPDARDPGLLTGAVAFEQVRFAYKDGPPILDGIDLHVRPGETIALVGPSGAGKTTMMALLQRFYDPDGGRILVDGVDLRGLKQGALRRQMAVVLQDAILFNDTIRNNIAYGRPAASLKEIEAAAVAANAHGFVSRLPHGYDSTVGERGAKLSAGERQRIAIARALLKDAPILILDEATASLDAELESLVQEALERLVRGRTTFVIAHRLATVVNADRILVLKDGRIAESGTHHELMARGDYYAWLVNRQTRGLLAKAG
jgi:ATP-binding cassette, subfamily B, bacterial